MNIEILKDGAVYVGGVLDQKLTKKNRAFYHQKFSALLDEIILEIEEQIDPKDDLQRNNGYSNAAAIVESKKWKNINHGVQK